MDRNKIQEELNEIRNAIIVILDCIDKIENEIGPVGVIKTDTDNWTSADEQPTPSFVYMKDLKEATVLKDKTITGQITSISDTTTFTRKSQGTVGAVKNWVIEDRTGDILVVFWDEQIDKINDYMLGETVEIRKAWQVKRNTKGKLELHPGMYFDIQRVE